MLVKESHIQTYSRTSVCSRTYLGVVYRKDRLYQIIIIKKKKNGYIIIIILHKGILIKLCQICLSSAVRNVVWANIFYAGGVYKILHFCMYFFFFIICFLNVICRDDTK